MKNKNSSRRGVLAGGNWIIDQVKLIDVFPQREQLANIRSQSQGTGGQHHCPWAQRRGRHQLPHPDLPQPLAGIDYGGIPGLR